MNHTALRCWFKPPLHRTRKYPLLSDSVGGGGQWVRGAEDALQSFESAVLHNLFTSTSLSSSNDVSTRNNMVENSNKHCMCTIILVLSSNYMQIRQINLNWKDKWHLQKSICKKIVLFLSNITPNLLSIVVPNAT